MMFPKDLHIDIIKTRPASLPRTWGTEDGMPVFTMVAPELRLKKRSERFKAFVNVCAGISG